VAAASRDITIAVARGSGASSSLADYRRHIRDRLWLLAFPSSMLALISGVGEPFPSSASPVCHSRDRCRRVGLDQRAARDSSSCCSSSSRTTSRLEGHAAASGVSVTVIISLLIGGKLLGRRAILAVPSAILQVLLRDRGGEGEVGEDSVIKRMATQETATAR
jgi:hypothetical protein